MLRINLSELKTFRITCKRCNRGVIEVPLSRLDAALDKGECRFCQAQYIDTKKDDYLDQLKHAIEELNRLNPNLSVEFEIPAAD